MMISAVILKVQKTIVRACGLKDNLKVMMIGFGSVPCR